MGNKRVVELVSEPVPELAVPPSSTLDPPPQATNKAATAAAETILNFLNIFLFSNG